MTGLSRRLSSTRRPTRATCAQWSPPCSDGIHSRPCWRPAGLWAVRMIWPCLRSPPRTLTCSTAQCICPAEHRCCPVATCIESICERAQQTSWSDIWVRRAARRPFSWRCPWPTRSTWSARRQPAAQLMQPCNQGSSKPECYTAQVISDDNFKVGFNRCVRGLHVRSAAEQRQPRC